MLNKQTYIVHKDKPVEVIKEVVPEPVGEPLYEKTKALAEANPGFIACGVQMFDFKKDDPDGEIHTLLIPQK